MEIQNQNKNKIAGTIFLGCMFLGIGIGIYLDQMTAGVMIGMGVGFIASAITKAKL